MQKKLVARSSFKRIAYSANPIKLNIEADEAYVIATDTSPIGFVGSRERALSATMLQGDEIQEGQSSSVPAYKYVPAVGGYQNKVALHGTSHNLYYANAGIDSTLATFEDRPNCGVLDSFEFFFLSTNTNAYFFLETVQYVAVE